MKNYLLVLFVLCCYSVNAQIRRFEFSGGIGNNNQIQKELDSYFYLSNPLYLLDETQSAESNNLKYNLIAKLFFNDHVSMRVKYGHSKTHNEYDVNLFDLKGNFWNKQTVTNINPALCFNKHIGKLTITTGFEFAFYKVQNFVSYFEGTEVVNIQGLSGNDNNFFTRSVISETTIEGGSATGINGLLELQYQFSKRMGIGAAMSYGYLWTKFSDQIIVDEKYVYYNTGLYNFNPKYYQEQDKSYKSKSFSPPEFSVFLFLRLGKVLEASK